jgi:pimeloyl-ACP methyl ester carboxylesterase
MFRNHLLFFLFFTGTCFFSPGLRAQQDSGHYFRSFDGQSIYFEIRGNGYPIVFLHGFMNTGDSWKKTAVYRDLLAQGRMVITPDMRGNGRSAKPHEDTSYNRDAEARDIIGLLDSLGISHYDLVGYSRGSIIAARLLVTDSRRVERAVLGGMGTDFTNPQWPRRILFYHALRGDSVPELAGMLAYVRKAGLDQVALALLQKEQPSTSLQALRGVKIPVLVICGDQDLDNGSGKDLAAALGKGQFASVPGNHNEAWRSPEFSHAVLAFLFPDNP